MVSELVEHEKYCTACKTWKPASTDHFYVNSGKPGFQSWCRPCRKVRRSVAYKKTKPPKAEAEVLPEGLKRCRICEGVKIIADFYSAVECRLGVRPECKACLGARDTARRLARAGGKFRYQFGPYPAGVLRRCSICKKSKPATTEFFRARKSASSALGGQCLDCDRARARDIARRPDQINKRRVAKMNRRGRTFFGSDHVGVDDVERLLRRQRGRCRWCSKRVSKYHVDHVIPLSRGGRHILSNLAITCPSCNMSKSNKMPWEWRPELFPGLITKTV